MPAPRNAVTEHTRESLREHMVSLGEKPFRGEQILKNLYHRCATVYEEMTDLPAELRARLKQVLPLVSTGEPVDSKSKDGTTKLLVPCADGQPVECVLIPEPPGVTPPERRTVCVSSQAGCPVGCVFCASGLAGLARNLTAGEIVEQILRLARMVRQKYGLDHPINNVVYMGMGEPMYNFDAVMESVLRLNADWGMGIGLNKITISTIGIEGAIEKLAQHPLHTNLALSLHAPNDAIREKIVPFKNALRVNELLAAGAKYRDRTSREVTCEYVMLKGINSGLEHAKELARRLSGRGLKVNLIPYNAVEGLEYGAPSAKDVDAFAEVLERAGVSAPVRRARGDRIAAACGQLRLQKIRPA